ncbi:transcription elongation factor [Dyadobacter luticola]|uniref:transcription elongation factor n=1 Tax=Dyadobacter luticola TaxID=1979387 RepID=UPI001486AE1F|nr:transcription elongation factor [Dyadobacter luticola]
MDKNIVIGQLKAILDERMRNSWDAMEAAQESANEQGKSSMGDKYETSRSMGQLDRNMHARQFEQTRQERLVLERINVNETLSRVAVGSLLYTTAGWFFIAVSLGTLKIENETLLAVSSSSPVGASLLGKEAGSKFDFMKKQHEIVFIF